MVSVRYSLPSPRNPFLYLFPIASVISGMFGGGIRGIGFVVFLEMPVLKDPVTTSAVIKIGSTLDQIAV
jgi:hypothetical protein